MSQAKRYTITLAVRQPDGNQCFFDLSLGNLIGFSYTNPDSFLMQLATNLAEDCPIILKPEEMDSSRYGLLRRLRTL